ncbi:MAG: hypothetical protein AVO35_05075 [Candidatus Aegiribacteria sp. MLS_C]|nr:MAG: hypothetical protein AVO35_05075 [Candidatus Aegiribacteria sp. MLS_C]
MGVRLAKAAPPLLVMGIMILCCCGGGDASTFDSRFVVLGPSLVEIMFRCGLGERIAGVDRYSDWPPEVAGIPNVGGYLDPSLESIAALSPTSIHMSGDSPVLRELAEDLGIPCYSYGFDSLEGVFAALDSLDARYGARAAEFRSDLETTLDSLRLELSEVVPLDVLVVIYHEYGSSSMTVAGGGTYFADILERLGCRISAPGSGAWPMVSAEGAVSLGPDHVILLFPGGRDPEGTRHRERAFWEGLGFHESRIHCIFEPYMMVPGGRLESIAEDICSCLL